MKTLIIVDVQNDFMPGGSLAVPKSETIIPVINHLQHEFELVIATQDWHPPNHHSFASNHRGKKPFEKIILPGSTQILWPDHCVQGSIGAEFHPALDVRPIETIFRKGTDPMIDSYSGFYDNQHLKTTGLVGYLANKRATQLYFCGLCGEFCVYFTIKDALAAGFECWLIEEAVCALDKTLFKEIKMELMHKGVKLFHQRF